MQSFTLLALGSILVVLALGKEIIKLCAYIKARFCSPKKSVGSTKEVTVEELKALAGRHRVAENLHDMIDKDGAGSWPPKANHADSSWPIALRPYKEIFFELAELIPQAQPSQEDRVNDARIRDFRSQFRTLLIERVDLAQVKQLLEAADAGRWEVFPRDIYNAFYCCIGNCRHAYRWGTIPVVKIAQLEKQVDLPAELVEPWKHMQQHFGCPSESGNITSNMVLNFDTNGTHVYKANTGMREQICEGEEAFCRIFYDIEKLALPIYHDMAQAIITFACGDKLSCAAHIDSISQQLRLLLDVYYKRMHDKLIARSVWLSHIQGFQGWGVGDYDEDTGYWEKYDGLSGNQVLLFQALDAFLDIDQYLEVRDQERNVPKRQRDLIHALRQYSFRRLVSDKSDDEDEKAIVQSIEQICKRLRMFRATHRSRSLVYLAQDAPERLPMTAGKTLLAPTLKETLYLVDGFMVRRFDQTV